VAAHIAAAGLPASLSALGLRCTGEALVAHMLHDKKMDSGKLPFLLMRGLGQTFLAGDVDLRDVAAFLGDELAQA
jgi:3-dehydroquinate synthase